MDRIRLTDAITGNRTGLDKLCAARDEHRRKAAELNRKADELAAEINARRKMADAMDELQKLMPKDETIMFLVP